MRRMFSLITFLPSYLLLNGDGADGVCLCHVSLRTSVCPKVFTLTCRVKERERERGEREGGGMWWWEAEEGGEDGEGAEHGSGKGQLQGVFERRDGVGDRLDVALGFEEGGG